MERVRSQAHALVCVAPGSVLSPAVFPSDLSEGPGLTTAPPALGEMGKILPVR